MNDSVAQKVQELAPILQKLREIEPDWYEVTTELMQFLEGRNPPPNWELVARALLEYLSAHDQTMMLIEDTLKPLGEGAARDCEEIGAEAGLAGQTVRQVLNALTRGGYRFVTVGKEEHDKWRVTRNRRPRPIAQTGRLPKRRMLSSND